jgi:predicted nucleic acid-binding protein
MAQKPSVSVTPINRTEVAHAFYGQAFRSKISIDQARLAWQHFQEDCSRQLWEIVDLPVGAWDTCTNLARRYGPTLGVRTLDSLHVACALELKADKFWTFDERQEKLARAVGLDTNS